MLDYKNILIKRYVLHMTVRQLAKDLGVSKSEVNDFLNAFEKCETLVFSLPERIMNHDITELFYGKPAMGGGHDDNFEFPDFPLIYSQMTSHRNMTHVY